MQPVAMARPLPDMPRISWPAGLAAPATETDAALDRAAAILRSGGLVAVPTETVYGLAADALDPDAVASIFRAKGRPASNPVIVHVADAAMARGLAADWPAAAEAITARLWPGPVTVVVPRAATIPPAVTAGGATVALRCPGDRLFRRLIEKTARPLAAPSANRSEALSPTTAHHVLEGLGTRIDLILDGGPCGCGIESTVVDCTTSPPRILRPGPVSHAEVENAIGGPVERPGAERSAAGPARSPGMAARHYAPRTPLELAAGSGRVGELVAAGRRVGWLTMRGDDAEVRTMAGARDLVIVPMPPDPAGFARSLYATLHALDKRQLDVIVVDPPPDTDAWRAVRDRLARATAAG